MLTLRDFERLSIDSCDQVAGSLDVGAVTGLHWQISQFFLCDLAGQLEWSSTHNMILAKCRRRSELSLLYWFVAPKRFGCRDFTVCHGVGLLLYSLLENALGSASVNGLGELLDC